MTSILHRHTIYSKTWFSLLSDRCPKRIPDCTYVGLVIIIIIGKKLTVIGAAGAMMQTMMDFVRELKGLQQDVRTQVSKQKQPFNTTRANYFLTNKPPTTLRWLRRLL